MNPRVLVEDDGDTIRLGELSPGCRACKDGKWDCLFLSLSCNLSCAFCLTPCGLTKASAAISAFGNDLDTLCKKYSSSGTIGVGFSGGDPLLKPKHLLSYISRLRERRFDLYIWVYTRYGTETCEILAVHR
ncbi:MAG: 4Fe-4S cluster-binding domain-containing protein [Bacteroides sp.]|nr:4Fe-4S cluster-binding domain-containing protein [Bacteroides sp.]